MPSEPTEVNLPRTLLYAGDRVSVYGIDVPARTGGTLRRELVTHPGAVVILPLLEDDRVCLIKNWRYSAGAWVLELPAGTLDPGEPTLPAARRELAEETGYAAQCWTFLTEFWVSPGVYGEKMWLYLARGLSPGLQRLDETERIETVLMPWDEAVRLALQGTIQDAKTIVGLLLWDRLRHESTD